MSVRLVENWSLPTFLRKERTRRKLVWPRPFLKLSFKPRRPVPGWELVLPSLCAPAVSWSGAADALPLGPGSQSGLSPALSAGNRRGPARPFSPSSQHDPCTSLTTSTGATSQACAVSTYIWLACLFCLPCCFSSFLLANVTRAL